MISETILIIIVILNQSIRVYFPKAIHYYPPFVIKMILVKSYILTVVVIIITITTIINIVVVVIISIVLIISFRF